MPKEINPEDNIQKSLNSLEDQPKKEKRSSSILDKLIVTLVVGVLCYVGISFLNCNFLIPGSMVRSEVLGGLKNPPPLDCKESESKGYSALFTLFTGILGLKAKMD